MGPFFTRLNNLTRWPSLDAALIMAAVFVLLLAILWASRLWLWGGGFWIVGLCVFSAIGVLDLNLLLPAMVAITAGQLAREDIKAG